MTFDIQGQQLQCGRCGRTESVADADQREARYGGSSFSVDLPSLPYPQTRILFPANRLIVFSMYSFIPFRSQI